MRKYIKVIVLAVLMAITAYAVDVKIGWELNPPEQMVTKYVIYQANGTNGVFTPAVTVLSTTNAGWVKGLGPGLYRFVVVAQNSIGNAPPSSPEIQVPTNAPTATQKAILLEVK